MFTPFRLVFFTFVTCLVSLSCISGSVVTDPLTVTAAIETESMPTSDDSADDPAIWVHPTHPAESRIVGANKKAGLFVYDLSGKLLSTYDQHFYNNVDIRTQFPLHKRGIDLIVASNKENHTLNFFTFDGDSPNLRPLGPPVRVRKEVYGLCLYADRLHRQFYAFATSKSGNVEQWEIVVNQQQQVTAHWVRDFAISSQSEGCVADDEAGVLFVAEETKGIWKFPLHPQQMATPPQGEMIASISSNQHLAADIEGLTVFYGPKGQGFLMASIQGKNEFALFERRPPHQYLYSVKIAGSAVDAVTHTDGIDVVSTPLGAQFPQGLLVVQDDENLNAQGEVTNQNFKYISWEHIMKEAHPQ